MLAGGTDLAYRSLLATNPRVSSRVEVWRSGARIDEYGDVGLPLFQGSLQATLLSQVSRTVQLSTDGALFPEDETGLLAPYGNELRIFQTVHNGAGVPYEWQVFRGRINTTALGEDGATALSAIDRGADVNDAQFTAPESSQVGYLVVREFRRIVSEGVADAEFGTFDPITAVTPELVWEWDRGSAADDLATAGNAYWYPVANGDYVMRFVPWAITQVPLLTLSDGPGGVLTSAVPSLSREDVFNMVTVIGERADGDLPVYATAYDNNPASPTYVNGGFGLKSKLIRMQTVLTDAQALYVARTALRQAKSLTRQWSVEMPADPSMELGDCFDISARGLGPDTQVVSQFSLSLTGDTVMNVELRALQPNPLQITEG